MNEDMEYTYEFLRKCHGLRFKAVRNSNDIEGIIKVEKDGIALCYGEETKHLLGTTEEPGKL